MAAALTAPVQGASVSRGTLVSVVGTGFANTTAFTVTIDNAEESESVIIRGTTSGGGALTTVGVCDFYPYTAGVWTVRASDGTSTVTLTFQVFSQ